MALPQDDWPPAARGQAQLDPRSATSLDPTRLMRQISESVCLTKLPARAGPGWYGAMQGSLSVNQHGSTGQNIHGGPFYGRKHGYYHDGLTTNNQINYAWQLRDVEPDDGGFVLIVRNPAILLSSAAI